MTTAGWILWILWTLIIVALVVAGIVWLISALSNRDAGARASEASAREILDRRLASGEITLERYDHLRDAISPDESSSTANGRPHQPASTTI